MALRDYCDKLEPLPTPIGDIAQELENAYQENTPLPETTQPTEIDTDGETVYKSDGERKAERTLVSRQELRRSAFIQQLVKDAKTAIKNISNLNVDLENASLESFKEATLILEGTEAEVLNKLRENLNAQVLDSDTMNYYLEYVKNLL